MRFIDYLKDKIMIILLNIFSMFLLTVFLALVNNTFSTLLIIIIVWTFIFTIYLTVDYIRRDKYFTKLEDLLESLDKRYLISEVMDNSYRIEDRKYKEILRRSNKSVIEKINQVEDERKDYKEYIESWVHEVKLPITTMELICENNKDEVTRKIQAELSKVDNLVESVLFYARAEKVYKDYLVKEVKIKDVIFEIMSRNKAFFIQNRMMINVECEDTVVVSDKKWLSFILNQVLINSVKYKRNAVGKISIYAEENKDYTKLYIKDDGIGIKESEINRIFNKGFTGTNGRENNKSTGMGLYLCKKLCDKLAIEISAESKFHEYTKIVLTFPKNNYLSKL